MDKQPELFNEFRDTGIKPRSFSKSILPERTFTVIFTYEKMIFTAIAAIIILAIIFALGFECGKRSAFGKRKLVSRVINVSTVSLPVAPAPAAKKSAPAVKSKSPAQTVKPYTIQVATFKSKEYAQAEASKLRSRGYLPTIIGINGLYQVWAGEYSDMKEASVALSALRKFYKDCNIRKR